MAVPELGVRVWLHICHGRGNSGEEELGNPS